MKYNYNEKQLEFIKAGEDKVVVTAPPGSGKTFSIVGAVKEYQEHNPNDKIVAITYTKKATKELETRIGDRRVEISTIHSWSFRQLQKFAVKYGFSIELLDDETIKDILQRLCRNRKQYSLNKFQLFHFVMGNYNIDIDDAVKKIFYIIDEDYKQYKRANNLYDFTDLPLYLNDVLTFYKETITEIDAIFVDEFQDVDPVQVAIFERVLCKKKVLIGDAKQSIFLFRDSIQDLNEAAVGYAPYHLDTNYRSYQEIIDYAEFARTICEQEMDKKNYLDFAVDLIDQEFTSDYSTITCERGLGGKVYQFADKYSGIQLEPEYKGVETKPVIFDLIKDSGTQILCRSNKQVKRLEAFGMTRVSTVHQAKGLEYDNVIVVGFDITSIEELNVMYVAMTRAKNVLVTIDYETIKSVLALLDYKQETVFGQDARKLF